MLNKFFLVFGVFLIFGFVSAVAVSDDIHLNIQTTDNDGNVVTGTFDFVFNVTTDSACSSVVYSDSTSLTTNSRGIISYYLEDVSLDYENQYWLCYYRDGTLINNSKIGRVPYAFRAKYVNVSGLEVDQNLDMGSFNLSASYFFGDGSGLTSLNVSALDLSDYVPYTGSLANIVLGDYNFSIGGTDFFVDASLGRVGIGTSSPSAKLDVDARTAPTTGTSEAQAIFQGGGSVSSDYRSGQILIGGTANTRGSLAWDNSQAGVFLDNQYNSDVGFIAFRTRTSGTPVEGMRIQGDGDIQIMNGNLGIGITDPNSLLVVGGIETSGTGGNIQVKSDVNDYAITLEENSGAETWQMGINSAGDLGFTNSFAGYPSIIFDDSGNLIFNVTNSYLKMARGDGFLSEILHVDSSTDNLIIGDSTLDEMHFDVDNVASALVIDQDGKVGIGTASPSEMLSIGDGTIDFQNDLTATYAGGTNPRIFRDSGGYLFLQPKTGVAVDVIDDAGNAIVRFDEASKESYFFGDVGIGTTSPAVSLDVQSGVNDSIVASFGVDANNRISLYDYESGDFRSIYAVDDGSFGSLNLGHATSPYLFVETGGQVGIGTASPSEALDVQGNISASGYFIGDGRYLTNINSSAVNESEINYWVQSGTDLYYDDGSVGIGTESPDQLLHVKNSAGVARVKVESSNVQLRVEAGNNIGRIETVTSDPLSFRTNDTTALYIDTSQNVGIGTSSPGALFHVNGSATPVRLQGTGSGVVDFGVSTSGDFTIDAADDIRLDAGGADVVLRNAGTEFGRLTNVGDDFQISSSVTNGDINLLPNGNGNVGIGTSTPAYDLHVNGSDPQFYLTAYGYSPVRTMLMRPATGGIDTSVSLKLNANTDQDVIMATGGGNVGIGTSSPDQLLEIQGDNARLHLDGANAQIYYDRGGVTNRAEAIFQTAEVNKWIIGLADTDVGGDGSELFIGETSGGSSPALWIESGGNVGIGTTSPAVSLDVQSGTNDSIVASFGVDANNRVSIYDYESGGFRSIYAVDDGSYGSLNLGHATSPYLFVETGGNVGIGTSDPGEKLEVQGKINATGDICIEGGNCLSSLPSSGIVNGSGTQNYLAKFSDSDSLEDSVIYDDGSSVGIGTSSPTNTLSLVDATPTIDFNSSNHRIEMASNDLRFYSADDMGFFANDDVIYRADVISFETPGASEKMRIDTSTGNIGIGTTSPSGVTGNTYRDGNILHQADENATYHVLESTGGVLDEVATVYNNFGTGTSSWWTGLNQGAPFSIAYGTSFSGANTKMTILENGNVGIGTTSPGSELEVQSVADEASYIYVDTTTAGYDSGITMQEAGVSKFLIGNYASGNYLRFYDYSTSSNAMVIEEGGNVGINESSPEATMHVTGDVIIEL